MPDQLKRLVHVTWKAPDEDHAYTYELSFFSGTARGVSLGKISTVDTDYTTQIAAGKYHIEVKITHIDNIPIRSRSIAFDIEIINP